MAREHSMEGRKIEIRLFLEKSQFENLSQDLSTRKLYVQNIPLSFTERDLRNQFASLAPVERAYFGSWSKDSSPEKADSKVE